MREKKKLCDLCEEREVPGRQSLCNPCAVFDHYHRKRGHGPAYFAKRHATIKMWDRRYSKMAGGGKRRLLRAV